MEIIRRIGRFPWLSSISIAGLCLASAKLAFLFTDPHLPGEAVIAIPIFWGLGLFVGLLFALGAWNEKERWWKAAVVANVVYLATATIFLWVVIRR